MKNAIKSITGGQNTADIFKYVMANLYMNGPTSITDLEILSYLALYRPEEFEQHKIPILNYMAVFYKPTTRDTLAEVVFTQYRQYIRDTYSYTLTPVQADIIKGINGNTCFSFSAPTSTGKSFVFRKQIEESQNDVVVVVPSRALINEYYLELSEQIKDQSVNILTFIDKINTRYAKRSIFIVTPERCRELFKQREQFKVDLFLFDEAQLSDEDSKRGLYFDSIVRRCQKAYPEAKFIFAHPFVQNPESQIEKNHFEQQTAKAKQYIQKNVGQLFLCQNPDGQFSHFGIDQQIMGHKKIIAGFDPLSATIQKGGTVLIYTSKQKIYNGKFLEKFAKYVALCDELPSETTALYLSQLKEYTGGDTERNAAHYSLLLDLLCKGIVIHHGSLPLHTRLIIEQFTKAGHCRICFATSTLEQGINMPFDVVYLDRLEGSKPLAVKNLIGRAGRSTRDLKFDYGYVIVNNPQRIPTFRKIMTSDEILDNVSSLEKTDLQDDDYNDFRDAILNGTYSDEYNLTEKDLEKLSTDSIDGIIEQILNSVFEDGQLIAFKKITDDLDAKLLLYAYFRNLYTLYLSRSLSDGEARVLDTAVKIMLWRVYGRNFKNICWYRYSHASKSHERAQLENSPQLLDQLPAAFITGYKEIPDKELRMFSLFPLGTKAKDVSYDLIMYDTYDYIDKLIGFKLSDIFYAAFWKYAEKYQDDRAKKLALYVRYGTESDRDIWMLRYGMSFEDIEVLDQHIASIDAEQIIFRDTISTVPDEKRTSVRRFIR
ncbi:DEAD/DEAH box helicase [Mucilaginibacter sp. UR6-1]|uniref:DEAD/DEAH box helicase n=1 Tax=Mucilaginibacter sp. UR6-1 TaxID=1435643 RepID=UPI001E493C06|nr:DEAD/DEAH box helicase [Mucilaginibacter sp. UR6-1]MCC8407671.1 DEAD/DEAH box helicase [Mucilaginibacter sp. UR6-1]